ncbi:MAG: SMP-30/gluconolactonase/LRE family protein [Chloroflexota bacterium]
MADPAVFQLAKNPDQVGENPLWHPGQRRIYWTDNRAERVYRMDPATRAVEVVVEGLRVYAFTFQPNDDLALFLDRARIGVAPVAGDGYGPARIVNEGFAGEADGRFNDVIADKAGRVLGGVVPMEVGTRPATLYSIATDGSVRTLRTDIGMPNGMAFSPDERFLYVADTRGRKVLRYAYDDSTGEVSGDTVLVDLSKEEGASPDGLTVDAAGHLWVAFSGGWSLVRFDPTGREVARVRFPARKITSAGFGGGALDTLYVTTSSRKPDPDDEIGPEGGAFFAVYQVSTGKLDHRSSLRF